MIFPHLLWHFLLLVTFVMVKIHNQNPQRIIQLRRIKSLVSDRINSSSESSLLILSTSIFNQFLNMSSSQFLVRWSFYLAVLLSFLLLDFYAIHFSNLDLRGEFNLVGNLVHKKNRAEKKCKILKSFFLMQIVKKYLISIAIVFLEKYPVILCSSCASIYFISFIASIWMRPYNFKLKNLIKILGEGCMTLVWIIFLIKFAPF